LKLDLGCGINKKEGFTGVDERAFPNVDVVHDLTQPWPWKDDEVEEAHCSHFIEHLTPPQRIHFVNELYRVLQPLGKCTVIVPSWSSCRAYGDLTHQWPPVSEMWFYYLNADWRSKNAPHNDFYTCDFDFTSAYGLDQGIMTRNQEFQAYALRYFKEAAQDIMATLTTKGK
jgi:predicted SAM-dependent methyltransferase